MPSAQNLPYKLYIAFDYYSSGQRLSTNEAELGYGEPPHGTQSLVLKVSPTIDGVPLPTTFKSFTYNLNQNRPVTFNNLFAPGTNPMDAILSGGGSRPGKGSNTPGISNLRRTSGRTRPDYQNFAITDDAVIFYFAEGEMTTLREAGTVDATVPRAALPPLQIQPQPAHAAWRRAYDNSFNSELQFYSYDVRKWAQPVTPPSGT